MATVDIIIPTFNSPEYSIPCVRSLLRDYEEGLFHIYLVNNGIPEHQQLFPKDPNLTILQQEKNLGWEGGLKAGLAVSKAPFVVFMNDDTFVPQSSYGWLKQLLAHFDDVNCAGAGPGSNVVMGSQQIFADLAPVMKVHFIIGLCFLVRRDDLERAGGVDDSLPGGDDLDLSIRLRDLGKYLVADRRTFVYHHGFKTGTKVHGNDWNSLSMLERTNHALIRKHGLRKFLALWRGPAALGLQ